MRTRAEAVALIMRQLERLGPDIKVFKTSDKYEGRANAVHYGRQELKQLMDFIYGGTPELHDEVITGSGDGQ